MTLLVIAVIGTIACLIGGMYGHSTPTGWPKYHPSPTQEEMRRQRAKPWMHLRRDELRIIDHAYARSELVDSNNHKGVHAARHIKVMEARNDHLACRQLRKQIDEHLAHTDMNGMSKDRLERLLSLLR